ncbi:hypothetical protein F4778DRAFT_743233 [Xylariomycetidae sp. FL2044]|nr:hypothetical protein F4778DRAFT_743233 [Xylariomycetidae sp. FL2044]
MFGGSSLSSIAMAVWTLKSDDTVTRNAQGALPSWMPDNFGLGSCGFSATDDISVDETSGLWLVWPASPPARMSKGVLVSSSDAFILTFIIFSLDSFPSINIRTCLSIRRRHCTLHRVGILCPLYLGHRAHSIRFHDVRVQAQVLEPFGVHES